MATPIISYFTPYATDGNLAREYNRYIKMCKPGDYACFTDRDTWFPHPHYGKHIEQVIREHGKGFYTCVTNRTNCPWQRINVMGNDRYHVEVAKLRWDEYGTDVEEHANSQLWSGHLMIVPVDAWIELDEVRGGILGIDNKIHLIAQLNKLPAYLMKGIYLWHYYSGHDGEGGNVKRDKSHLK